MKLPEFPLSEENEIGAIVTDEDCPTCQLFRHCPILAKAKQGFFPEVWVRENWDGDQVATCTELTYLPSKWEEKNDCC